MTQEPLLSICIPNFNMRTWLTRSVNSALLVTHADEVEVVVVDNCSRDGSRELLEELSGDHERLRVVFAEEHVGMAENWNRAVLASTGQWCVVLSADDELDPGFWEQMRDEAVHEAPWAAISQWARVVGGADVWGVGSHGDHARRVYDRYALVRSLPMWNPFPLVTTAFRRDVFDEVGGFSNDRAGVFADYDFWSRCVLVSGRPILALGAEGGSYFCDRGRTATRLAEQGRDIEQQAVCLRRMYEFLLSDEELVARRTFAKYVLRSARGRALRHGATVARRTCKTASKEARGVLRLRAAMTIGLFATPAWHLTWFSVVLGKVRTRAAIGTRLRARLRDRAADSSPRALVVSHHAGRTGAAIVLRDLARAGAFDDFDAEVLLLGGGPLTRDFARLGRASFLGLRPAGLPARALHHLPARGAGRVPAVAEAIVRRRNLDRIGGPNLLYLNTALAGRVLPMLARRPPVVVAHIHELAGWLDHDPASTSAALSADAVIAVSEVVRDELRRRGVADDKITVVHGSIPTDAWPRTDPASRAAARRDLEIPPDAFVVLGAGTVDRRKGADLFVETAAIVASAVEGTRVRFLWCGNSTDETLARELAGDVERLGLERVVTFAGEVASLSRSYQAADVFALTSREDPFPLVCLEAAATGLPVVAFRDGGGTPSFIEDDAGIVVEEFESVEFADAVLRLLNDPALRTSLGERAAAKVRERHGIAVAAKAVRQVIRDVASANAWSTP